MKKLVRTSLNNVANKRGVRDLNIQLYSHDKNNAGFEFVIKNEVDLSEYKAKVLFDFQESFATWETKGTIEGNVVKVKFDTTFITKCEEVIGYLFLDSETDTLDVFKFKFNVVLSEIDKYDLGKRGFRYIKDQEVVDVITRSELRDELAKLQVTGGVDLSGYLTTTVAEETYAKKTDLPTPYNDSALVERVTNLENKTDRDTVYDDTSVKERLTTLENKPPVDLSNYVTNEQISSTYATKSEIPQPYSDTELVKRITVLENKQDNDTVYDDAELKRRVTALEEKPNVDTSNFVTTEVLESKGYLTHQDLSEYAQKSELYNDSDLKNRVYELEYKLRDYEGRELALVSRDELRDYVKHTELPAPYDDTGLRNEFNSIVDNELRNKENEFNSKFVLKDDLRTLVTEIVTQLKSENN